MIGVHTDPRNNTPGRVAGAGGRRAMGLLPMWYFCGACHMASLVHIGWRSTCDRCGSADWIKIDDMTARVRTLEADLRRAVEDRAKLVAVLQAWGDRFDLATHAEWEELVKRTLADVTGRAAGAA